MSHGLNGRPLDFSDCVRLKRIVDFAWRHQHQRILDWKIRILGLFAHPDFMQTLATDAPTEMGMQLKDQPISHILLQHGLQEKLSREQAYLDLGKSSRELGIHGPSKIHHGQR